MSDELFTRLCKRKESLDKLKNNSHLKQKAIDCISIDNQEDLQNLLENPFKEKSEMDFSTVEERYDQFVAKYAK